MRCTAGIALAAGLVSLAAVPSAPRYTAAQLHCARFLETSRSEIHTEAAAGTVEAVTEREGVWNLRARDTTGGILLEAWYDSLVLRRRSGDGEVAADTDGLIGGRYRGVLTPTGAYTELARPFIPDEVAEIADLSGAARDLLPPLPPRPLAPGRTWSDSAVTLSALPDTAVAGESLGHLRLESRAESREAVPRGDTVPIPLRQTTEEKGDIYWSPRSGLVRRIRRISVEAEVPSGGRVRRPVRSRIEQRVELTRLPATGPCR